MLLLDENKMKKVLKRYLNREPTQNEVGNARGNASLMAEYMMGQSEELPQKIVALEEKVKMKDEVLFLVQFLQGKVEELEDKVAILEKIVIKP